jgi:hypothetical protein
MEFAAPTTKRAVPAMMADTRGSSQVEMENVEIYDATKTTPWERRFNPYDFNGGYVFTVSSWACLEADLRGCGKLDAN